MHVDVIVIGAGLSGLVTAHRLAQRGWSTCVLERSMTVGGRATSVHKAGYLFDAGAVGIGTNYEDYLALVGELGLASRIVRASSVVAVLRGGVLHEIDSKRALTALTTGLLSVKSKVRLLNLMRDLVKIRPYLDGRDLAGASDFDCESVETYARRRLNAEILDYLVEPLIRTVNLTRAANISSLEFMNSLAGLFSGELVALEGGVGVVTAALAQRLDVRLNCTALAVRGTGPSVEVSYESSGVRGVLAARACAIATPLPQGISMCADAGEALSGVARSMRYARGLCVHLGYRVGTTTKALMVMLPPGEEEDVALYFLEHNKAPDRAPTGHSLITVFYEDRAAARDWELSDEELVRRSRVGLEGRLTELVGALEMYHVSRWPYGLTTPVPGFYQGIRRANLALSAADRVQLCGDYRSTAGQNSAVVWANNAASLLHARLRMDDERAQACKSPTS